MRLTFSYYAAMIRMWRLSEAGEGNLGLACTENGLVLGRTPLVERQRHRFVVRDKSEIERLLCRAYQADIAAERLMPGLATVAAALNADDLCLAAIAAVHLRIPDLPDQAARDGMVAEDTFIKYARDESGDGDWNPALHPRTGTRRIPAGSRRPTANHRRSERRKTTIRRSARMLRPVPATIG